MLAVRTGLSPVMIGRAAELARLRELRLHHRRPHPRERELAALVAVGCSNGEVA
ncbi:MAG TPA: hypothetical protein VJ769_07085 [Actinomycetes bacterium]|nr:hypothetical protein [Actinomycetes bacterium]